MQTKSIAWDSGGGYIRLTYTGSGNGSISIISDQNDSASARSKTITVTTTAGSSVKTKNVTVTQDACPVPVGTVLNYAYTGSYQEVLLPAGQYKLQCWGAQGGSNAAASSYGISAKAGGKGGYSEGVITLSTATKVRVYVGGAGSPSAGGFNGGGSTSGSASYNSSNIQGVSRMGGGGGATDIRLSDGALLSRMIVAGGGSGGAYCYKKETIETQVERTRTVYSGSLSNYKYNSDYSVLSATTGTFEPGKKYNITITGPSIKVTNIEFVNSAGGYSALATWSNNEDIEIPASGLDFADLSMTRFAIYYNSNGDALSAQQSGTVTIEEYYTDTDISYNTDSDYQTGFAGGGTNGQGYSSSYQGKQDAAGNGGSFGQGANQTTTNYRFCSGAGGGGWYGGGGGQYSDSSMTTCRYSGGGSGWVNIAANASYRPSGYTGLQLDSGTTKAGNTSFPSTSGGTETGHSGNGYARITRLS